MLRPCADKTYDYWIYICPKDIQFSTKQAVKSLRATQARGAVPWGTIEMDGTPILDQLTNSVLANRNGLPTEVSAYVREIIQFSNMSEAKAREFKSNAEVNRELYETN